MIVEINTLFFYVFSKKLPSIYQLATYQFPPIYFLINADYPLNVYLFQKCLIVGDNE